MKTTNNMDVPKKWQKLFERAKTSRSAAVKANCISCCGFSLEIAKDCRVDGCPLMPHNPYRN
jgi:hypothetical protein